MWREAAAPSAVGALPGARAAPAPRRLPSAGRSGRVLCERAAEPRAGPGAAPAAGGRWRRGGPDVGVPSRAEGGAAPGGRCGFISAAGRDAWRRQGAASNRRRRGRSPPHRRPRPARPAAGPGAPALAGCCSPGTAEAGARREREPEKKAKGGGEEERGRGRERAVARGGGTRAAGS